ncbi:dihydropteroate synthase [Klugiella xanthotipulae]|uniref:Dihydropteroate synthase n=1 Tax=Klugiella xanthotipulae TaxID=244735 RepID=A0A543I5J8_9MICO|nr:dihydropteroate synthase [Klugiella xanthotipulae]TQM65883.1 dihydropteroate synthase [Klugiella xanthotipulae]
MTLIMGVLNVTPDSFSDGGRYLAANRAVEHALRMRDEGADIVDVGGESTRPGAVRITAEEEQDRILPVVSALVREGITVSVDTVNAATALSVAAAGARIINDVSGGLADPGMFAAVAGTDLRYLLGHWRDGSQNMDDRAHYADVPQDVRSELQARVRAAKEAGVGEEQLVLDPGLGFSKVGVQNWQLLARFDELRSLGHPVMVGASRKRFLAELLPADAPVDRRDLPTAIVSVLAAQAHAWAVRVHNVSATRVALDTLRAWQEGADGRTV